MSVVGEKLQELEYTIRNPRSKIDLQMVSKLAEFAGVPLPRDYVEFLREFPRGGFFYLARGTVLGNRWVDSFAPEDLYGTDADGENVLSWQEQYEYRDPGVLLIGSDKSGNQICIGINKENYGKILFWHADDPGDGLYPLAENFMAFILKLKWDGSAAQAQS